MQGGSYESASGIAISIRVQLHRISTDYIHTVTTMDEISNLSRQ